MGQTIVARRGGSGNLIGQTTATVYISCETDTTDPRKFHGVDLQAGDILVGSFVFENRTRTVLGAFDYNSNIEIVGIGVSNNAFTKTITFDVYRPN